MALLHNRVSNTELKKRLEQDNAIRVTISFYQYFFIQDPQSFRDFLYKGLFEVNVFGRIYIAHEGINAQVSVPEKNLEAFRSFLYSVNELSNLRLNIAAEDDGKSFWVLKIKVRDKIVADGINDPSFNMENKGRYVNAREMNEMMKDPQTIVVDMRNHYEYEVGHFENAIEIPSDTFREQLPMAVGMLRDKQDKNIIMYCTGGIRCEKASTFLLHKGFKNVFHLEGGVINYARQMKESGMESKFKGKNFVFDNRLGERITEDIIAQCHQCGNPCDTHTNCKNNGCHLLFIQCYKCAEKYEGCCSIECAGTIELPDERQKELRKGMDKGQHIFNKSRQRVRPEINKKTGTASPENQ